MKPSEPVPSPPAEEATPFDDGVLYDLFCGRLELGLDFYLGLAKMAGGPVLDLACGTGRILLPCLKAGVDVEGLDLFPNMLAHLRHKASALGFEPRLHQSNMAGFRLPRRYALIMIALNAFVHNLTTEDQLATLNACHEHLQPGGMLVFDTAFPGPAWIAAPNGTREMEMEIAHPETGLPVRMWDTRTFDRGEAAAIFLQRNRVTGSHGRGHRNSSIQDRHSVDLQSRDGVAPAGGRICALADSRRFRRPAARA